ncbi:3-deoxy-D-manno-octulosonate 8-phosphate phosphatase, YrbI family [groundwater metagenome]|uniref:3-deoxy-D-manno-octulosonate 8-phosphate phosphatase, YrbI family n=1 Tax=groundwater metagenome TaxID=717931 RepID=A0A098EBM9_9ZZZZ
MEPNYRDIKIFVMDFDGVLTDNYVYICEDGKEFVRCTRADGIGLKKLHNRGIDLMVISKEINLVVSERCKKLKIKCFHGIDNKADFLKKYLSNINVDLKNVAFVGNDENDIEILKIVGFPMAVNDAYPKVKGIAKYISKKQGGCGAVREICDMIDSNYEVIKNGK